MGLLESIILGIIQGLTEFLPVSSSAHLLVFPWLMGWQEPPFVFDTSLHIGTLVALFIYFRTDIKLLIRGFFKLFSKRDIKNDPESKLTLFVLLGSLPAGIIGLLFEKKIEAYLHSPYIIVFTLIIWGILLWYVDKTGKKEINLDKITISSVLFIGFAQALALIPGTSRSGVTMTAALFSKYNRETAAKFSFLLSIPITTGAALYKLKDLFEITLTTDIIINFLAGILSSGIIGYLCIAYLLKFLKNNSFSIFAVYRIIAGLILLVTLPSLLQGKIELKETVSCFISSNQEVVMREKNEKYIFVNKGDKVILEPNFENITSYDLKDLELAISIDSPYAKQININTKSEISIPSLKIYPEKNTKCKSITEIESMGKNFPFIIEIDNKVKSGTKITVNFILTNLSGKKISFPQTLKVN
ncbi:MAG: undecaprenyl-diphosphatase UppP [Candidatus Sericytochromatia bacterium]